MKLVLSRDPLLYSVCPQPQITNLTFQAEPLSPPRPRGDDTTSFFGSRGPRVAGSCLGLLVLNFPDCCTLWNPSTGTHHRIPEPEDDAEFAKRRKWRKYCVEGLVYDGVSHDYKFVRVYQYLEPQKPVPKYDEKIHGAWKLVDGVVVAVDKTDEKIEGVENYDTKVLVYSLRANSWERVADFPYVVKFGTMSDVLVNGGLHFEVSSKKRSEDGDVTVASDCMIAAFDVSNHTCRVVSHVLASRIFQSKCELKLGVLGECLCIIRNYESGVSQCMIMKEYGDNSSWVELFRVRLDVSLELRFKPISYFGGERLVLLEAGGKIFCIDVENKSFINFDIEGVSGDFDYYVCLESDVVLGSVDHPVNEENPEVEAVLDNVVDDDNNKLQQVNETVNEENLEKVAAEREVNEENLVQQVKEQKLGNVDGDDCDKMQQLNEDVKAENLERVSADSEVNEETLEQVNDLNLESESVLGNVDGDDCAKMQQVNEEVKEENLERASVKSDLGAT